jgi:hypothetical protein
MLRIRIELVPNGDESKKRELARAELGNLGGGDYSIMAWEGDNCAAQRPTWESRGYLTDHDRRSSCWELVVKAARWAAREAEKL